MRQKNLIITARIAIHVQTYNDHHDDERMKRIFFKSATGRATMNRKQKQQKRTHTEGQKKTCRGLFDCNSG